MKTTVKNVYSGYIWNSHDDFFVENYLLVINLLVILQAIKPGFSSAQPY